METYLTQDDLYQAAAAQAMSLEGWFHTAQGKANSPEERDAYYTKLVRPKLAEAVAKGFCRLTPEEMARTARSRRGRQGLVQAADEAGRPAAGVEGFRRGRRRQERRVSGSSLGRSPRLQQHGRSGSIAKRQGRVGQGRQSEPQRARLERGVRAGLA